MEKAQTARKPRATQPLSARFIGSWKLVSYELVLPSGKIERPFGRAPSGVIVYQPDGHMSVQISEGRPAKFASNDLFRASTKEAARAWRNYFGYWGTFTVDAKKRVVVHRVEGGSFPNWFGTKQVRHFRFDGGGRLVLETTSAAGRYTVTWRKARRRNPKFA